MDNLRHFDQALQFREKFRKEKIPSFYSGIAHLFFTTGIGLTGIIYSLFLLRNITWLEFLTIPITFLYADFTEYIVHRNPMHHKTWGLSLIFQRHTLEHHNFFTDDVMACERTRDFKIILFPPIFIILFFGLFAVPVGVLINKFISHNAGYLFVATALGYFLNYEWLHMAYHQGNDSIVNKLPFIVKLRKLHTTHHNKTLMGHYNFNITYPIFDWIFGTLYKGEK